MSPRSVLHVLPHPGGGGETYVDSLAHMAGYDHSRFFLASSRRPLAAAPSLATTLPRVNFLARRFDIVHVHGEVSGFFCLPALAGARSLVTLHGLNLVRRSPRLAASFAASNLRLVVRAATRTICVSEAERQEVLELVGDRMSEKLVVVANGVPEAMPPSMEERRSIRDGLDVEGQIVALSVGALDPPKDPFTLTRAAISAARSGSGVVLLLVGDGGFRRRVEDIALESRGVVRVLGHRDDVASLLRAADVFLLSSSHEGLPYALLEAMSAGLPSVVSDYPGAVEAVGDAALIVPRGDVEGFRQALEQLAADDELRSALGERARKRVESQFSLKQMVDGTQRVYDDVIGYSAKPHEP